MKTNKDILSISVVVTVGILLLVFWAFDSYVRPEEQIGVSLVSETILDYRVLTKTTETKISNTSTKEEIISTEYVEYAYPSEKEVPRAKHEGLDEDMSQRTQVQQVFPTGNKDEAIYKIYSGTRSQFYDEGDKWVEIDTATTTVKNFEQMSSIKVDRQIAKGMWYNWFVKEVLAADYPTGVGDGRVYDGTDGTSWADERGSSAGTGANDSITKNNAPSCTNGPAGTYNLARAFYPADTSGIGAGKVVTAGTFNWHSDSSLYNDDNGVNGYYVLVDTTQANTSGLVVGDFDQVGSTELSNPLDLSDQTAGDWNAYTLIQAGYDAIDVDGTTKIGAITGFDINNSPCGETFNEHAGRAQEYAGTTYDPYYTITAAAGDSCTCTEDGTDWYVKGSDNCYLATSCDLDGGELFLLGDGTFSIIDNAVLSISGLHSTGTDMFIKAGATINFK